MPHTWLERRRIHRQAKAKLGLKQSPQERFDFMRQCIDSMTSDGLAEDENQAEEICQLLWEEQGGAEDYFETE